jgi:hypothetical protein
VNSVDDCHKHRITVPCVGVTALREMAAPVFYHTRQDHALARRSTCNPQRGQVSWQRPFCLFRVTPVHLDEGLTAGSSWESAEEEELDMRENSTSRTRQEPALPIDETTAPSFTVTLVEDDLVLVWNTQEPADQADILARLIAWLRNERTKAKAL